MKKLSIEEKAKAYDEAIAKGKQIQNTPYTAHWDTMKEVVEHLLPELAESEDEKIRKMLIEQMERWHECALENNVVQDIKDSADAITWLEKQGEQKEYPQSVKDTETSETNNVELTDFEGALFTTFSDMWQDYMLGHEVNVAKAVKEHSAELLEIANRKFLAEWSDHDEDMLNSVKLHLDNAEVDAHFYSWLDNLKDRVQPQPKQEWSEEDKENLYHVDALIKDSSLEVRRQEYLSNWFKSLKYRVQPQQEWSKEESDMTDKITLREFINELEKLSDRGKNDNLEVGIQNSDEEFCPIGWCGVDEYYPIEEIEENNPQHPTKCIMIQY